MIKISLLNCDFDGFNDQMLASAQSRYLHALCLILHFPCQRWLFNKGLLYWLKPINTWSCNLISSSLWLNVRSLDCLQWHIYRQHLHLLSAIIKAEHVFLLQFCGRKTTLIQSVLYTAFGVRTSSKQLIFQWPVLE